MGLRLIVSSRPLSGHLANASKPLQKRPEALQNGIGRCFVAETISSTRSLADDVSVSPALAALFRSACRSHCYRCPAAARSAASAGSPALWRLHGWQPRLSGSGRGQRWRGSACPTPASGGPTAHPAGAAPLPRIGLAHLADACSYPGACPVGVASPISTGETFFARWRLGRKECILWVIAWRGWTYRASGVDRIVRNLWPTPPRRSLQSGQNQKQGQA